MTESAYGVYDTRGPVEAAVAQLKRQAFLSQDISVLFPENADSRLFARQHGTVAPEGTATGETAHMELDGSLGILDPAAGPKMGALPGALRSMGIPDHEAAEYGHAVKKGGILVSVKCGTAAQLDRALDVLEMTGSKLASSSLGRQRAD